MLYDALVWYFFISQSWFETLKLYSQHCLFRCPAQYCKNSSKNGTLAAQRLVDGRRVFEEMMAKELLVHQNHEQVCKQNENENKRKIYALVGHGVPDSLLEHIISTGRTWLRCHNDVVSTADNDALIAKPTSVQSKQNSSAVHLSLRNIPNSTMFDRDMVLKTNACGSTSLIQWPNAWDHDLELFMVVMNRIGSRLSSVVLRSDSNFETNTYAEGSIVVPSDLEKWNVSIRKGEVLPLQLLPQYNALILTVEWLYNSYDCWTLVVRLQDRGLNTSKTNPLSLVFEGVYVAA